MRDMTTAEFAKANLAALEEPVSIRRYTKVLGTYYPEGFEPATVPPQPTLDLEAHSLISDLEAAEKHVRDLEDEVRILKKELAKRPLVPESPGRYTEAVGKTMPAPRRTDDPFIGLAKQDRDFFERKLGKKK